LRPAVFLDRDGVLIEESGFLFDPRKTRPLPGVADELARLDRATFRLAVVTNQTVVARGLATETQVDELHQALAERLAEAGGPPLAGFYVCPHHPCADVERYRIDCDCRKPRPGLLLRAAEELSLDLARSFMVGDRLSDVAAGVGAGCQTVLMRTGAHLEPPIQSLDRIDPNLRADYECGDFRTAVDWILGMAR
jgi:D-glycero-D-manno-heptose 1,7-bisphosphate phosphatase